MIASRGTSRPQVAARYRKQRSWRRRSATSLRTAVAADDRRRRYLTAVGDRELPQASINADAHALAAAFLHRLIVARGT
jgi:hypothetical protein